MLFSTVLFASDENFTKLRQDLEYHLDKQIIPIWTSDKLTDPRGGFLNSIDENGIPVGQKDKPLIAHLRLLYVYAIAIKREKAPGKQQILRDKYQRQLDYLITHFRDNREGGWFAAVDVKSQEPNQEKKMISNIYALYILSQLSMIFNDPCALRYATESFIFLNRYWDSEYGGYFNNETSHNQKEAAINFHALAALNEYFKASKSEHAKEKMEKLYQIILMRFIDNKSGHGYLFFKNDWNFIGDINNAESLYGHDAELLWFMIEASETLEKNKTVLLSWLIKNTDAIIKDAISPDGAVYGFGTLKGKPIKDEIDFWCQAEAMILLSKMYEISGDKKYLEVFYRVKNWTFDHFVRTNGLWRLMLKSDASEYHGIFAGAEWRGGLHETRMLVKTLEFIERMENSK